MDSKRTSHVETPLESNVRTVPQLHNTPEESKLLSIRRVVENFPWELLPSERDLPTADMGTKKTTTFLNSDSIRQISVHLRLYQEKLSLDSTFDPTIGKQLLNMPCIFMLAKFLTLREDLSSLMLAGITDESLPLELTTVEELIGLDNAKLFELEQHRTALRDFQTDKPNVYKENQVIPVRTLRHLGHGGWAQVDCVENAVTGAQMARKRFRLKRTQAKKLKQSFETEIASLKKLNGHQHIIRYLYSYETEQTLNILLSPVANCNLYEYLEEEEYEHELGNRNDILIQSLGCLASALAFMHQHRIRHKDVKSQNVLLYQHDGTTRIIVTDFGISFDFSSKDNSVTEGATHKTRKYCSPEVARDSPRGRKSDVYSLGCIYLEILTVLSRRSVGDLEEFLGGDGNYYESQEEMHAWVHQLSQEADETISLALKWCSAMIQRNPIDRPYISRMIDRISFETQGRNQLRKRLFCAVCLSELRIKNLIVAEGVDDEEDESEGTGYEDNDEKSDSDFGSRNLGPRSFPSQAKQEPREKKISDSRGYHTISVHIVYMTKVFESCIRAFDSITKSLRSSSSISKQSKISLIRFEMEYLSLINWSSVVGLSGSRQLASDLLDNQYAILNVLLQHQTLLENCWKNHPVGDSLDFVQPDLAVVPPKLPRAALSVISFIPLLGKAERLASKYLNPPPTLAEGELDILVQRLTVKNDDLIALLSEVGKDDLFKVDEEMDTQILHLYNTFDDLVALETAFPSPDDMQGPIGSRNRTRSDRSTKKSLAQSARLKAINSFAGMEIKKVLPTAMAVEKGAELIQNLSSNLTLDRHSIKFVDNGRNKSHRVSATLSPDGIQNQPVWIEWKYYEQPFSEMGAPQILERITALASLLHDRQKPKDLRVPHCLGLFQDIDPVTLEDHCRFGLVFGYPASAETEPVTLLDLLHDNRIQPPPLETRICLGRSISKTVDRVHAVNWLHKGLRSANILLCRWVTEPEVVVLEETPGGAVEWSLPYISGFDISRPAMDDMMTEEPMENASENIYRHPMVQGSFYHSTSYKRSHDIYSLGIILLEIALWCSIDQILGINEIEHAHPRDIFQTGQKLLGQSQIQERVRFSCGTKFADIIWTCLEGIEELGLAEGSDERTVQAQVEFQNVYYERVVRPLAELSREL